MKKVVTYFMRAIFVQQFNDNFYDNLFYLFFYWSKTIERKKIGTHDVSMREKVVQKLLQNSCTNIIYLIL